MTQYASESKEIQGHMFTVAKLPPLDAQDVMIDIGQALAPALGKAAAGAAQALKSDGESILDINISDPKIADAIGALIGGIGKAKMRELVNTMASVTKVDDLPLTTQMSVIFRGNLPLMYQWLWFSLAANFGNFTGWVRSATSGVLDSVTASQSRPTSKGIGQQ